MPVPQETGDIPAKTDPYTAAVVDRNFPSPIRNGVFTVVADLGRSLEQKLTHTFRNEAALSAIPDVRSDARPGYDYSLREQTVGLNYVLNALGQEKITTVANRRVQSHFQMPEAAENMRFPEPTEPDPFREAVVRRVEEQNIPTAAVTIIADLGRRYQASLFATTRGSDEASPISDPLEYAQGLRFILDALGQGAVAEVAENNIVEADRKAS
jgi:hypothetical protein